LITTNLVAILLLIVLAAAAYNRLAIEHLSPPVYSIRVKPSETWHHVTFIVSPWYGFHIDIDGGSRSGRSDHGNAADPGVGHR